MDEDAPTSDLVGKPLNITDEFRRAKRNSLVWSVITIAACLANSRHGPDGEVISTLAPMGLHLTQNMVVVGSAITSFVMVLGYYRAASLLRRQNSQATFTKEFGDITAALRNLSSTANEIRDELITESQKIIENRKKWENFLSSLPQIELQIRHEKFGDLLIKLERCVEFSNYSATHGGDDNGNTRSVPMEKFKELEKICRDGIDNILRVPSSDLHLYTPEKITESNLVSHPNEVFSKLCEQIESFNRFSKSISFADKAWLCLYDHTLVYGSWAISFVLSIIYARGS